MSFLGLKTRETKEEFIENYLKVINLCYRYGIRIDNTNLEEKYFSHVSNPQFFMDNLFETVIPKKLVYNRYSDIFLDGYKQNVKNAIKNLSTDNKIKGINRIDDANEFFSFIFQFLLEEHSVDVWSPGDTNDTDY